MVGIFRFTEGSIVISVTSLLQIISATVFRLATFKGFKAIICTVSRLAALMGLRIVNVWYLCMVFSLTMFQLCAKYWMSL